MHEQGSYIYILSRNEGVKEIVHKKTLNEAKFYGFEYFYEKDKPFYRFTKIPFPHLFYVSEDYIVYVEYARLKEEDIPYVTELSPHDDEIEKEVFPLFTKTFNKKFVHNPEARAKYRDRTKRDIRRSARDRKKQNNRIKHHNAYSD